MPRQAPPQPVPAAFAARLAESLDAGLDSDGVQRLKQRLTKELGLPRVPTNSDVLAALPPGAAAAAMLRKKPARSQSGVAVVAVMSSPAACPHGKCVYCPGGPDVGVPQSYTGHEPSTMRAMRLDYDPYRVVRTRLGVLARNGHAVDKVELIIQGGTFPAREAAYQDWFVAMLHAACNDGPADEDPGPSETEAAWHAMAEAERTRRLRALQEANVEARCRAVGLTVETKPDWCREAHVDRMLAHGVTRVELGLQALDDDVLRLTHRGHTLQDAKDAMRIARDAGLKVCVHLMPGLPRRRDAKGMYRTDTAEDAEDFRRLFEDPAWRPDMLKVYPTLVVQEGETPLKRWWREGRYEPLDTTAAASVIAEGKRHVPEWCRIQRVDRDIPTTHVEAGVQNSNLRQFVQARLAREARACRCLRCREPAARARDGVAVNPGRVVLRRIDYAAAGGTECFLLLEDPVADAVVAYLRLRRVGPGHREETRGGAIVRELKVLGVAQALGAHDGQAWQHQGHGSRLLQEAEGIAFGAWGVPRLLVIAGVGVKGYYRRRGYAASGPYEAKEAPASPRGTA